MSDFLIVDDERNIRKQWKSLLEGENHYYEEAECVDDVLEIFENLEDEDNKNPFDLILLDHNLGDETGLDLLKELRRKYGNDFCQNQIIVITGFTSRNLAVEYAKLGAIGHLLKPVNEIQFWLSIDSALQRRADYIEQQENWEAAYILLNNLGIIESVDNLSSEIADITQQYEILESTYRQLLKDLEEAGEEKSKIGSAYNKANIVLNLSPGSIDSIKPILAHFKYSESFWKDIENLFKSDRLRFYVLQSFLKRIIEDKNNVIPVKALKGSNKCYEYRVAKDYRLYYQVNTQGVRVLERFGHKKLQDKIIENLIAKNY